MRIWTEELGGIRRRWIRCSDGVARCLGEECAPDKEMARRAEEAVRAERKIKETEAKLQSEYPDDQIYESHLPQHDIHWNGESGRYMYVLGKRKKGGRYQIKAAVGLERL